MGHIMIDIDEAVCARLDRLAADVGCDRQAMIVRLMDDWEDADLIDEVSDWAGIDPLD